MLIGYAMIGKLAPKQYQGVMMGSWMLVRASRRSLLAIFRNDPRADRRQAVLREPQLKKHIRA